MDRGVWWAVVHWVTKTWMQLTDTDTHVLGTGQCRREWNPFLEFRMEGKGTNPTTVRLWLPAGGSFSNVWKSFFSCHKRVGSEWIATSV